MYTVSIKEYNNSESGCLITLCYFQNTFASIISNLVHYWAGNNILAGVDLIQSGFNLQWIPTVVHILFLWHAVIRYHFNGHSGANVNL